MRISHNIPALQAVNHIGKSNTKLAVYMQNLSSGVRINSAADDAAGLAVANKLRNQTKGLNTASQNALDGISLIQTAEGALGEIHNMLQRMRELAVQAATDTLDEGNPSDPVYERGDKGKIQMEIDQLAQEITDTATKTEYNKIKVLSGELYDNPNNTLLNGALKLQVGPNRDMEMHLSIPKITYETLFISSSTPSSLDYTTTSGASDALSRCDAAISRVSQLRAELGAAQNRLEHTVTSLDTTAFNTDTARSRIEDTDMAKEMTLYTSANVVAQAGMSILAQANQRPSMILQLLGR